MMPQPIPANPVLFIAGLVVSIFFVVGIALDVILLAGWRAGRWSLRRRRTRLLAREWTWGDGGLLVIALLGAQSAAAWATTRYGLTGDGQDSPDSLAIVVQTLLFHGIAGLVIAILLRRRKRSWKSAFGAEDESAGNVIRHAAAGIALYVAAMPPILVLALLYRLALNVFDVPLDAQPVLLFFTSPETPLWLRIYLAVLAVAVAPVVEEMCFRGIALPLFCRTGGMMAGIVAVSALFAAVHFHLPSAMPLFGIAVAFALGYLVTGSLVTPIVMHALFNAVSLGLLYLLHAAAVQ